MLPFDYYGLKSHTPRHAMTPRVLLTQILSRRKMIAEMPGSPAYVEMTNIFTMMKAGADMSLELLIDFIAQPSPGLFYFHHYYAEARPL